MEDEGWRMKDGGWRMEDGEPGGVGPPVVELVVTADSLLSSSFFILHSSFFILHSAFSLWFHGQVENLPHGGSEN
jgi:hypothetical protein